MLGTGLEAQSHFFDRSSAIEAHGRLAHCASLQTEEGCTRFWMKRSVCSYVPDHSNVWGLGVPSSKHCCSCFIPSYDGKISAVVKLQRWFYDRETFTAHVTNCNMKAQGGSVCLVYSLQSSEPRSSQDRCTQLDPSPSPEPGNKGSATCCVLIWCAPQRKPSCCQTCPFPTLQETLVLFNAAASKHTVV